MMLKQVSLLSQFKLLGFLLLLFFVAFAATVMLHLLQIEKEEELISALHIYHALVQEDKNISEVSTTFNVTSITHMQAQALMKDSQTIFENSLLKESLYNGKVELYYTHKGSIYLIDHHGKVSAFLNSAPQMEFLVSLLVSGALFTASLFGLVFYLIYLKGVAVHLKKLSTQIISYAASNNIDSEPSLKSNGVERAAKVFYALIERNTKLEENRLFFIQHFVNEFHTMLEKAEALIQHASLDQVLKKRCNQIVMRQKSTLYELMSLESIVSDSSSCDKQGVNIDKVIANVCGALFVDRKELQEEIVQKSVETNEHYFTLLLRTLLDNALEYKEADTSVFVSAKNNRLCIKNQGKALEKEIEYYFKPMDARMQEIEGLGLTLAYELASRLRVRVIYSYENNCHSFCVVV